MKKCVSKVTSLLVVVMMAVSMLSSIRVQAVELTTPPVFSEVEVRSKMNTLIRKLSNRYFTTNQRPAGDVSVTCDVSNVAASEWLIELLNDGNYDSFDSNNFPCQFYTTSSGTIHKGGHIGYSCWGFANFVEYYLYSSCSTDNLVGELIYSGYASMDAVRQYARTGDIIRFGSSAGHSVVFYAIVDENSILALDSNWYDDCMVTFGERGLNSLSRNGSRMMTITRASNYEATVPSTPQNPTDNGEEREPGEEDYQHGSEEENAQVPSDPNTDVSNKLDIQVEDIIEVTSNGLNLRSWFSSSSPVLTVLPNRAQVKVLGISEDGHWAQVSYNGCNGWIFLNYVKKVETLVDPLPIVPSDPEVTPIPEDKPSSEIPEQTTTVLKVVEVTAAGLNCREGSSTNFKVVQVLNKGIQVEITEISPNGLWGKCEYAGIVGWISLNYTKDVETKLPEVSQPETSEPESSAPEVSQPEVSEPESSAPEVSQPEASEPESSAPEVSQPEASQPESSAPEVSQPETSEPESSVPEVSQPEESKPEVTPSNGRQVVITGNWLNVRKGPNTKYDKIGELAKGDQVLILETTEDGGWGRFLLNGKDAWIFLYYTVDVQPESSVPEASQPESSRPETSTPENPAPAVPAEPEYDILPYNAVHHVTATLGLNMRVAPGSDSKIIYGVPYTYDVTVTEITKDGIWGKITLDGYTGWINLNYTKKVDAPVVVNPSTPSQTPSEPEIETNPTSDFREVTATLGLNMRVAPGADSKIIYGVPYTCKVEITEISDDGVWGKTTLDGYTGWINLNYTKRVAGSPSQIPAGPQIETKPYSDFRLVTATLGLNMRVAPGADSKVIYGVPYTYKVVITEISSDGVWGKTTLDGYTGWINLKYTQVIVSFSDSSNQDYLNYPTLSLGSTGSYVEVLQSRLMELGYDCSGVDGSFGNLTYTQVVRFQKAKSLKADGIVEKNTWKALYD